MFKLACSPNRRLLIALLAAALAGCGGGGASSSDAAPAMEGSRETRSISSRNTGSQYPLSIYLPPASAGARSGLPVIFVLDGESWFETLVTIAEATRNRVIIVAVHTAGLRGRDFVPANGCTPGGGGHVAYFDFIRQELLPYVHSTVGGHPGQRALFGHSHGGSFVLHAMFAEAPGHHSFKSYLASDASVACMSGPAADWEQHYGAAYRELPLRLHLSYATLGNFFGNLNYADVITKRNYTGLTFTSQAYNGTHVGIVPYVLAGSLVFAFAGSP